MQAVQPRFSDHSRAHHPFPSPAPHPRAVEMAETGRDIAARGSGVEMRDLVAAGFTMAEITEHWREAEKIFNERSVEQVSPGADLLAEMMVKAREAVPNFMPRPKGMRDSQAAFLAWNRYCAARNAFALDHWDGQRERCVKLLASFFRQTPAGEAVIAAIVSEIGQMLAGKTGGRA